MKNRRQQRSEAAFRVLDSIEAPTAALDSTGRIVAVNAAWRLAAAEGAASVATTGVGVNYLAVCDQAAGAFADGAAEVATGIRAVLGGELDRFAMDYVCSANGVERWFSVQVTPMGELGSGAGVTHFDITQLMQAERRLQRDVTRVHTVFEGSPPIYALIGPSGVVQQVSATTNRLFGLQRGTTLGTNAAGRVDPLDLLGGMEAFARVLATPGSAERRLVRAVDDLGRWRQFDIAFTNLVDDPTGAAVSLTGCDVTQARLEQIAHRLESRLLQRLPTAVIVTDERGVVVYWNDRAASLYGQSAADAIGRSALELNVGPTGTGFAEGMGQAVMSSGRWEGDYDARRADGAVIPIRVTLERVDDDEIGFHGIVGASIDISERRQLEEHLAFQALHDPVTGLPNRTLLVDHLENSLSRSARTGRRTAVLFIDLDDFKPLNDRIGHVAGDEVLRAVGELISGVLRTGDIVGRIGGDEFVVVCNDLTDPAEVYAVIDRILAVLVCPFRVGPDDLTVSASVGVALSGPGSRGEGLLRKATAAMNAAKEAGKARVEVFDDALHEQMRCRRQLATELEKALDAGQLQTHFQPQIALSTGVLVGFEALVRWTRPNGEKVSPADFIPVAEESGLISRIGRLVLVESCRALASWLALTPAQPLKVSVNVSGHQLADPGFPGMVRGIVEEARVSPRQIVLEVTESALVDADLAAAALCELKAIGVEIAIDDFGTGYSSLSRLKRFPVDYLKIDQSFVAGMTRSSEDAVIVAAVLGLAETLGLRTVAEGIEEETQLRELAAHGCQMGQGFLWSPALPPEEAARWAAATSPFPHAAVSLKPHVTVAGNAVRNASNKLAHELATPITALVG